MSLRTRLAGATLALLAAASCSGVEVPPSPRAEAQGFSAGELAELWEEAIASIADPEDCPRYGGLRMQPLPELVPLGRDPDSGLWEFADARSGRVPDYDPETGRLELLETSAAVFVLVPGGSAWIGAQREDPEGPNFDRRAQPDEAPVHEVVLSPFLVSKWELTQAQWKALTGSNPSRHSKENDREFKGITGRHPVESVSWEQCAQVFRAEGWDLPTEAQWEYAARAGTDTPWYTGSDPEALERHANLADDYTRRFGGPKEWDYVDWTDPWHFHTEVGSLAPNAFGLFDVHGNVWEWCRDAYDPGFYARSPGVDPVADGAEGARRVRRGGGFNGSDRGARVANRQDREPDGTGRSLGVRPVIELAPAP